MAGSRIIKAVKGMNDVRPEAAEGYLDARVWAAVLAGASRVLDAHGFRRVWLPAVEETALFARGIGEETDIVSKEMYTFQDRGGRSLTLRPEGTAGAVRAYIEHNLGKTDPIQRWWYAGPMFRAERPQKGRYRQFFQIGAEWFGVAAADADADLLLMLWRLCETLGLQGVNVHINSVGDADSRRQYRAVLTRFLSGRVSALCASCQERLSKNPLRVLDCKRESCRAVAAQAPDIMDSLTPRSREHFERVLALLDELGVALVRDPRLVRGLDYYTGTIFEFTTTALGAQDAILGGGRYDDLVEQLGGPSTSAIGFAAGLERLALIISDESIPSAGADLYIVPLGGAEAAALKLADGVRRAGPWRVEVDLGGGRVKTQMKRANRSGAKAVVVLGEDELASGWGKLRVMQQSSEIEVELEARALRDALSGLPRNEESC